MKLTVLVPSDDYRSSAGARIRYGRLAQGLSAVGVSLHLESITAFDPAAAKCDALLISKCHDAKSLLAAAVVSRRGKLVGVDLFDDYFSQATDSRLNAYREWLAGLLQDCDFCLCSTDMMAEVVQSYKPELPTHVVNDPARAHSVETTLQLVESKIAEAHQRRIIRAAWFGVGDNPYFPVGLTDLYTHASVLSELTRSGMAVELAVLTNRRSLRPEGLELISRLPVPCTVMEWSESAEREVLEKSLLAFLPVATQRFSSAKSLNRAFTALSYGCQVLSVGHPLYATLQPLVYREPNAFLADLSQGRLRLSAGTSEVYREKLHDFGSAETEALRLAEFMKGLVPAPAHDPVRLCVVHGLATRAEIHHLAQSLGGLSVASPYCSANLDFDVFFRGLPPEMIMAISPRASGQVVSDTISRSERDASVASRSILNLSPRRLENHSADRIAAGPSAPLPYQLATYAPSMREIRRQLKETFGPIRLIISETSRVPVSTSVEA